jgi:hypothetical protein
LNPALPPRLVEIINKGLEKDREFRYQHAADMRSDLKRVKRDMDSGGGATTAKSAPRGILRRSPFGRVAFANTDLAGAMDHRYSILEAKRAVEQLLDQVLTGEKTLLTFA